MAVGKKEHRYNSRVETKTVAWMGMSDKGTGIQVAPRERE